MSTSKVVFAEPGKVALERTDKKLSIQAGAEVIVRNQYSLVSAGTELACLSGNEFWFPLPNTPGYASVGIVMEIGASVRRLSPGDLVFTHGPHSEEFKINSEDRYSGICLKLPAGLRPEQAVFARMATIAMASLRVSHIELGDEVLVCGLGQIGNLAAQLAALQGARVIGIDISPKRRDSAEKSGIKHVLNNNNPQWRDTVWEITGGRGVSTVIDATGLSAVVLGSMPLISPNGEIVLLGTPRAPYQTDVTEFFRQVHMPSYVEARGALEWRFPTFRDEFHKHSVERNTEIAMRLIAEKTLNIESLYTQKVPPEEAPLVYAQLAARNENYVGVVFDWTSRS